MKKILALLVVLAVVAGSVFAGNFYLGLGAGYKAANTTFVPSTETDCPNFAFAYDSVDLQAKLQYQFNNNVFIYSNTGFALPTFARIYATKEVVATTDSDFQGYVCYLKAEGLKKTAISESFGVGYAFNTDSYRFGIGAGLHYEYFKVSESEVTIMKINNFGVNLFLDSIYMFGSNVGFELALSPSVMIYNKTSVVDFNSYGLPEKVEYKGAKVSFAGSASASLVFKF